MKIGKHSWLFNNGVFVQSSATVSGPKEKLGPLGDTYDYSFDNLYCNEKTWEKAEKALIEKAINLCIGKTNIRKDAIDLFIGGDLLNQIVTTSYVARDLPTPYLGVFGACSTSMEALAIAGALVDSGNSHNVLAGTSSHYATAERQYRFPTEYGGQKPDTQTSTATGAGCVLVNNEQSDIQVEGATIGQAIDYGATDPLDLGSAMAPAAANTIVQHMEDFNRQPDYYDLILTGDLSSVGTPIFKKMTEQSGYDLEEIHRDCGLMIYHSNQKVFAGASGCASSALVTFGYVMQQLKEKKVNNVLVVATGALLNPTIVQQKESIPCIAHGVVLKRADAS